MAEVLLLEGKRLVNMDPEVLDVVSRIDFFVVEGDVPIKRNSLTAFYESYPG